MTFSNQPDLLSARFQWISPATQSTYRQMVGGLSTACWPEFMLHDPIPSEHWDALFEYFSAYQFGLLDTETGQAAAMANSVPLHWDGDPATLPDEGWDWAFLQAIRDHQQGLPPRTHCALQIAIHPAYRNQGLSSHLVRAMRAIGRQQGLARLIAPVRPNQKSQYPLTPIENYLRWQTAEGLPFDPWLRVHVRAGGKIIGACSRSMTIRGSRAEWESWTSMQFPESGSYIVPGALHPVHFDLAKDEGLYLEANVWTLHPLG